MAASVAATMVRSPVKPGYLLPRPSSLTARPLPSGSCTAYNSNSTNSVKYIVRAATVAASTCPLPTSSSSSSFSLSQQHSYQLQRPCHRYPQRSPSASFLAAAIAVAGHRSFSSSRAHAKDHHFDTLKFVQRLEEEGFSEEQARAVMQVLADVIEESIQNLTRTMVLREDALKSSYTQKVDFSALRTELLSLDNSETTLTRSTHERLTGELQKLNQRLRDEISRTQASVRLDLNLEKGRIREEANQQELKIKETETRIEQEVASLRERVEAVKFSTLQWLMGVCTGTAALILGAWRLLM